VTITARMKPTGVAAGASTLSMSAHSHSRSFERNSGSSSGAHPRLKLHS